MIDDGFLARVYRTSAVVGAIGLLACWSALGATAAAGWLLGALVSVGVVKSLEWIIKRSFVPGEEGARTALAKFSLVKLPVVMVVLGLVVWLGRSNFAFIGAFCAGLLLAQAVIVLKAVGFVISERLRAQRP